MGEEEIKALGFRQFRVRFHGEVVRIEIARDEMPKAEEMYSRLANYDNVSRSEAIATLETWRNQRAA